MQPFVKKSDAQQRQTAADKKREAAKRISQWKWLIIDEVSLLSAQMIAEIDTHLRSIMAAVHPEKRGPDGEVRPFGGLKVLFVGDFYQLDPPSGAPLATIPSQYVKRA